MTPTTAQKQPPGSQWFLALGENADFAPTIIHTFADKKLFVHPKKVILFGVVKRFLIVLNREANGRPLAFIATNSMRLTIFIRVVEMAPTSSHPKRAKMSFGLNRALPISSRQPRPTINRAYRY